MRTRATLLFLSAMTAPVAAQAPTPFDMSPERKAPPATAVPAPQAPTVPAPAPVPPARRYLLQAPTLHLQGENVGQAWTFNLTPEQAASASKLDLGYTNALVVAPEASQIRVSINETEIVEQPVHASERPQQLSLSLPPGLLTPGANRIRIAVQQRHRTDCTIDSTYELWTDIDAARTFLSFASPEANRMMRLEDIRAIGVDEAGRSRFRLVAPALGQSNAATTLLKLAEGLALLGDAVNTSFSVSRALPTEQKPGDVVVIAATSDEMRTLTGLADDTATTAGTARFIRLPGQNGAALAFTGADWTSIATVADQFLSMAVAAGATRGNVATTPTRTIDTPLIDGATSLTFASLGRPGEEFSGRRFATDIAVAMPHDFYANAYGSATILLDAAYTAQVLPGSRINITVNGNLATTVPITASGGAVLRQYPIRVSMQHFRPGVNVIGLEAMLLTEADRTCAPGAPAEKTPRFALFGTSRFTVPEFARLSLAPNLSATSGLGFPYAGSAMPTAVHLGRNDEVTLSAAATLLGKLAQAGGRAISIQSGPATANSGPLHALYIGTAATLPSERLAGVVLPTVADGQPDTGTASDVSVDSWRDKVDAGTFSETLSRMNDWMKETFNLDLAAVNLIPHADTPYPLPDNAGIFVSQSIDLETKSVQTVVSAANDAALQAGAQVLGDQANWMAIDGRLSAYDTAKTTMLTVPANNTGILAFQPASFTNLRLVAANWLSGNFVMYALGLALSAIALGLASKALFSRLGRNDK